MDNTSNIIILASITCLTTGAYFLFKSLFFTKTYSLYLPNIDNASIKELPLDDSLSINDFMKTINAHNNLPFYHLSQSNLSGEFHLGYLGDHETHNRLDLINTALGSSHLPTVPLGNTTRDIQLNSQFEIWNNYMSLSLSEKLNILYLSAFAFVQGLCKA